MPDWYPGDDELDSEVELDPGRMINVSLPAAYCSQLLMQLVRDLAEVPSALIPPWHLEQMADRRLDAPFFDHAEASRTERLSIAQAALPIGWPAREALYGPSRQMSEFYLYWRELRFLHFRSSLRARAEDALRKVLKFAGEKCGFVASVTANGLYTPQESEELLERFQKGRSHLVGRERHRA